jgi:hypothetical protein
VRNARQLLDLAAVAARNVERSLADGKRRPRPWPPCGPVRPEGRAAEPPPGARAAGPRIRCASWRAPPGGNVVTARLRSAAPLREDHPGPGPGDRGSRYGWRRQRPPRRFGRAGPATAAPPIQPGERLQRQGREPRLLLPVRRLPRGLRERRVGVDRAREPARPTSFFIATAISWIRSPARSPTTVAPRMRSPPSRSGPSRSPLPRAPGRRGPPRHGWSHDVAGDALCPGLPLPQAHASHLRRGERAPRHHCWSPSPWARAGGCCGRRSRAWSSATCVNWRPPATSPAA